MIAHSGFLRSFTAFIKKEFLHIFRDIRTMMILILMPIVQILLFGFALSTDISKINFSVLNTQENLNTKILNHYANNPYFNLYSIINTQKELEHIFDTNEVDIVLAFGNNFSSNFTKSNNPSMQFIVDASDPNYASTINLYAQSIFTQSLFQESNLNAIRTSINPLATMLFNPQGKSAFSFVPGLMGMILMLICAMMTSISIVREKEQGSMEILLVSPIEPIFIIVAKIIPYFVISCVILALVLSISIFALEIRVAGSFLLLLIFCMLYICLTLSIGLLVSNIAKTQIVAMLVCAMLFMMPIMMFSGMMFPIESMPAILQYFSHIIPTKWFIIGIKKIMIEGLGFSYVLKEFLILLFMSVLVLIISLKTFKIRLS